MAKKKSNLPNNLGYDLSLITDTFDLIRLDDPTDAPASLLNEWLHATYTLTQEETNLLKTIYQKVKTEGDYWNEEEFKIQLIGFVFFIANIEVRDKIKVFYERAVTSVMHKMSFSVIGDCLVATPAFNKPKKPYFFFQEYKKGRGDFKDPEAQMLIAMLIAQAQNQDDKPLFGSYNLGTNFYFTTLIDKQYCHSRKFDVTRYDDLQQIVFIIRKLKDLILDHYHGSK